MRTSIITLSTLTHAGSDRDPHFTRDHACKVLESDQTQASNSSPSSVR